MASSLETILSMTLWQKMFSSFSGHDQKYDKFTILDRIIVMERTESRDRSLRSIVLANISSISVIHQSRNLLILLLVVIGLSISIAAVVAYKSVFMFLFGILFLVYSRFTPRKWYLAISTNDGVFNFFTGNFKSLEKVKYRLDKALSLQHAPFTAFFTNGDVRIEKVENIDLVYAA